MAGCREEEGECAVPVLDVSATIILRICSQGLGNCIHLPYADSDLEFQNVYRKNSVVNPAFYLNTDPDPNPDPVSQSNADPDPGQTLKSQKVDFFYMKMYLE